MNFLIFIIHGWGRYGACIASGKFSTHPLLPLFPIVDLEAKFIAILLFAVNISSF